MVVRRWTWGSLYAQRAVTVGGLLEDPGHCAIHQAGSCHKGARHKDFPSAPTRMSVQDRIHPRGPVNTYSAQDSIYKNRGGDGAQALRPIWPGTAEFPLSKQEICKKRLKIPKRAATVLAGMERPVWEGIESERKNTDGGRPVLILESEAGTLLLYLCAKEKREGIANSWKPWWQEYLRRAAVYQERETRGPVKEPLPQGCWVVLRAGPGQGGLWSESRSYLNDLDLGLKRCVWKGSKGGEKERGFGECKLGAGRQMASLREIMGFGGKTAGRRQI